MSTDIIFHILGKYIHCTKKSVYKTDFKTISVLKNFTRKKSNNKKPNEYVPAFISNYICDLGLKHEKDQFIVL